MTVQDRFKEYLPDQRDYFDFQVTEDWPAFLSREWDQMRRFEVARLMRCVQPATILDVGCGCGFHDAEMARYPFVRRVDAIDYSPKSIEKAEAHYGHPKVRRTVADLVEFEPETPYDLVVSFQVIEHTEDADDFVRQCLRCCRPGGHVAIFTVNRMRPYNRRRARHGKEPELEDPMHKREFTIAELEEIGERNGLVPLKRIAYAAEGLGIPRFLAVWACCFFPGLATRLGAIYAKPESGRSVRSCVGVVPRSLLNEGNHRVDNRRRRRAP